jgi:hypothetical protein
VYIGTYELDKTFDPQPRQKGTTVIADDLHPQFTLAFQESLKGDEFKPLPKEWKDAVRLLSRTVSLQLLGDYWRLLWELAASAPIRYLSDHAVPDGMIRDDQQRLVKCNFRLLVDGRELFKPVLLEDDRAGFRTHRIPETVLKPYAKEVKFHGYIAVRDGSQIRPDELRGLMIRIKNVGIGYYDQTLLDYRINQGPRSRWVTGEIYVDEGLEDALNVDRDSFNRFHPDFKAVQAFIHKMLKEKIFPDVYRQMESRTESKTKAKERTRKEHLEDVVGEVLEAPVKIRVEKRQEARGRAEPHVTVSETDKGIVVSLPAADTIDTKKPYQQSAAAILAIFEIALREKTEARKREIFAELLLNLFKGW